MDKIPVRYINSSPKELHISESFSIRNVDELLGGEDMVQKLHRHDFFYILVLEKGVGYHDIDFIRYSIGNDIVFFMRPRQVHQLELKAGSKGWLMQFRGDFYPLDNAATAVLRKAGSMNLYRPGTGGINKLTAILKNIAQEYIGKEDKYIHAIIAYLDIFFIELLRHAGKAGGNKTETYTQERLEEFLSLLEKHIYTQKQVAHYAFMMNLSAYQLNSITKAAVGKTCSELINEHIMLEAKRHLLGTANQVKEIAWHLGYDDVSYFTRSFKKHTGYTPEAFRHNFK